MISLEDVRAAGAALAGIAHVTPVVTSRTLDGMVGASVFCKAESFQRGGAFKFRGAYNAISRLDAAALGRGVAAFSSGNHAQAVAIAAKLMGTSAVILMPQDTPPAKLEATRGYGADVVTYDRYTGDREALGAELALERGLTLVPPYEHPHVMAGQGTTALELIEQVGHLDVLVVPVGGGGLAAGCATAAKGLLADVAVYGVEPELADDTRQSLIAGERVRIGVPSTIADGLMADTPGALTFAVNRRLLDGIVTVSDAQILETLRFAFDRVKIVLEPSGAAALAAVVSGALDVAGRRVGVVLSGGNVGLDRFVALMGAVRPGCATPST